MAADAPTLQDARLRWLKGNYEESLSLYEDLAKDAKLKTEATVGQSRALESVGEYDKALDVVEAALKDVPKEAPLLARQAELLYLRGRWDDAEKAANAAIDASKPEEPAHFLGRWVRAQIYRDRGDMTNADKEFRWFVRTYTDRSNKDDDIKDPEELLLVGLAGSENARWHGLSKQFVFILQTLYVDAEKEAEKAKEPLWQAEYQAGALLLEKYNQPEAIDSFDKALADQPPRRRGAGRQGRGGACKSWRSSRPTTSPTRRSKINPRLPAALLLKSDVQLAGGDIGAGLADAEKALAVNPRDEHALARKAACFKAMRKPDDYDAVVKTVEKNNPKPAVFYYDLGERLEDRRYYDDAEACYKKAAELQPMLPGPSGTLGLLYMRMGREEEAAPLLDKGFEADKYNVRVANTRRVLKHLKDYETSQDRPFPHPLRPEERRRPGPLHGRLPGKDLRRPVGEVPVQAQGADPDRGVQQPRDVQRPGRRPAGPAHGRRLHRPHVRHGVAQRQGRPQAVQLGRVLRHEMVHIFNLEQTNFQTPHWLTEGLAVNNEGFPRPQSWNELLLDARAEGRPDGPGRHRPRLHPAADAGRLDDGLLPEPAVRRFHEGDLRPRFRGEDARRLPRRPGHDGGPQAGLRRGQAGLREEVPGVPRR